MSFKLQKISIQTIIKAPLFNFRYHGDDSKLVASIQKHGVLCPPHLLERGDGYHIIDGARRVELSQKNTTADLFCLVYDKYAVDEKMAFLLCLELNLCQRPFNLIEKARCMQIATDLFGDCDMPAVIWDVVGARSLKVCKQYALFHTLPLSVQRYAVENNFPLGIVLGLCQIPQDEIESVALHFMSLHLNQNKFSESVELVGEISKREGVTPLKVVEDTMKKASADLQGQPGQIFLNLLRQRRMPLYHEKLESFESLVRKLPINQYTRVSPAPFFEEGYVDVSTRIYSKKDLDELANLFQSESWLELIERKGPNGLK